VTHRCLRVKLLQRLSVTNPIFFSMTFLNCHTYSPSTDCIHIRSINGLYGAYKAQGIPTVKGSPDKEGGRVLRFDGRPVVLRFDGRPFPDVGLRGTSDPATCEDCHRDRRHPRLVTGPLEGPTGPRWDGGPAQGLIKLEVSLLGGSGLCHHYRRTQTAGWL